MLWQPCISPSLNDYIKKPENFEKLHSGNNYFKEANLISKGFASISKYYDDLYHYLYMYFQTRVSISIPCYFQRLTFITISCCTE